MTGGAYSRHVTPDPAKTPLTYSSYLEIDALLGLQRPLSDGPEHDELLFIVIHQTYELWFKQMLHELGGVRRLLVAGDLHHAMALLGRVRTILKTLVSQVDILETMTPLHFNAFRERLESSSGFQSAQFREFEAVLGRRDASMASHLPVGHPSRTRVESEMVSPSLWDCVLRFLSRRGYALPEELLSRDVADQYVGDASVRRVLVEVYRNDQEVTMLLERLIDLDEGLQEWRYRHVKMVERTIGTKGGTGGSSGVGYLATTLFRPVFPDLWAVRSDF